MKFSDYKYRELVVCCAIMLAGSALSYFVFCRTSASSKRLASPQRLDKATSDLLARGDRRIVGDINSPYTLIEFMDYQCPPCRASFKQVESKITKYKGTLRLSIHHFPLRYHKFAKFAALASESASQQADFAWIHGVLMNIRDLNEDAIVFALRPKLANVAKFKADCSRKALQNVEADSKLAQLLQVNATPTFFLRNPNGTVLRLTSLRQVDQIVSEYERTDNLHQQIVAEAR